ncbi:hypothetical protein QCA50_013340 [Cerrena zonata]|uniref:mRNA 3'-end-processing protein RNA14 n=1 Tax=Cerrena zonata TaxID=2478898 RepID=A0AAW0G1J4_9APHY
MENDAPPEQQIVNGQVPAQTQSPPIQQQTEDVTESAPGIQVDPRSEWDSLREHLKKEPQDVDSWMKLVDLAEEFGNYERTKETYEALLEHYPNTPSAQIAYINFVLESSHADKFQHAVTLFNRFLKVSPFVELWKFYLSYVKRMNQGPNVRDTVRKAYEYALNHIGHDKESTEIWTDYIQLLKAGEPANPWDEGQKMDAIRKAYQRAVQTPMDGVKRLWEEYQEFENNLNKITAKKFISDLQVAHMQARTVLNQLQEYLSVLFPPAPAAKPGRQAIYLPRTPAFTHPDKALVGRWRMYLKWEESNPLEIEDKDKSQLHARIQSVYRKAIVRMRYFSEIWYMAFVWTNGLSNDQSLPENKRKEKRDEAMNLLKSSVEANPSSFILNFAYAEALEDSKNFEEVHNTFKKFIEVLRQTLETIEANQALKDANTSVSSDTTQPNSDPNGVGNFSLDQSQSQQLSQQSNTSTSTQGSGFGGKNKELSDRRTEYGIAWIVYMRFARRAESLSAARGVFSRARKDKWTPWEVYEAAALMEYHCTKAADIATRIFEKGLEYFSDESEFALRYLGFLISINDDANARALFERLITMFPPERSRPIWERWARYEYQFGNLQAAQNLEKRMAEAFPNDPPIKRFAERHKYLGTDAIAIRDLGFVVGRSGSSSSGKHSSSVGRTETQQSLLSPVTSQAASQGAAGSNVKRPPSPDGRRKGDYEYGPPTKKHRAPSPSREREWDRDRREGHRGRRHGSPSWDRERGRDYGRSDYKEKEEEKSVTLPPVLSWFVGQLPPPAAFDGPVFRTDDLMQVFRNAVIPSSTGIRARSPPRTGGRPPPDYSPYTGPGGGQRRPRY